MVFTIRSLARIDLADRCEKLKELWPEFSEIVIARVNELWESNTTYKRRAIKRLDAFRTAAKPSLSTPAFLGWDGEVFEFIFEVELEELRSELWRRGEPSDHALEQAADIAIPSIRYDVALELSLGPRPSLQRPQNVRDEVGDPYPLVDECEFNGWYRIGYFEAELLNGSFDKADTISQVSALTGLVAVDNKNELDGVRMPFARVDDSTLWRPCPNELRTLLPSLRGGLVAGYFHHGFTIQSFTLACHPIVVSALDFRPGVWPGRLCMFDSGGDVAIVSRFWRTEPVDAGIAGNVYRLEGCDLLLRPDLFESLVRRCQGKLLAVHRKNDA